ncbi:MAG: hypothetical protein AAFU85_05005 [Planctomycetota bacterium]
MTFVTQRIEPTSSGIHVRYFIPNDPPDLNRFVGIAWDEVAAVLGYRIQYEKRGDVFRVLDIYHDDGMLTNFIDAPHTEGWNELVDSMSTHLTLETDLLQRLESIDEHKRWLRESDWRQLLVYQRDKELPGLIAAQCEFCDGSIMRIESLD